MIESYVRTVGTNRTLRDPITSRIICNACWNGAHDDCELDFLLEGETYVCNCACGDVSLELD